MLNNFFKTIHNKDNKFLRFIFFLRYLFAIFFIFTVLFLSLPSFFDYEKKSSFINKYLIKNYNFNIKNYEKIKFRPLPVPSLEIQNALIDLDFKSTNIFTENLRVYPKLFSIYNFENFQARKIFLENNEINIEFSDLHLLIKRFLNNKNKLSFKNLNIKVLDKNKAIVKLENLKFSNFGHNKNLIKGKIFEKNFKTEINKDQKSLRFKLINSGINVDIDFDNTQAKNSISGIFLSKILNTNLKFNFDYDGKKLKIFNSYFRNKDLSFKNETIIILDPFLDFESKFDLEKLDVKILQRIDLNKLIKSQDIIKKINSKNEISFKSKKFSRDFIDEIYLIIDLAYGRVNYSKKFLISENKFSCKGNVNLLDEFPLLFFDCKISSKNKKKLLKQFLVRIKDQEEIFMLTVKGNLNILNNKINFEEIFLNNNYKASKEDLMYFKKNFEDIVFDKGFKEMFSLKKIKRFILEVS